MKGRTYIETLGAVVLEDVSVSTGHLEVHVPIENNAGELDDILDTCADDYMSKHPNVMSSDELYFDVSIVFLWGGYEGLSSEFSLCVVVWQRTDEDTAEFYEEIPIEFTADGSRKIKKIIWDELGEMFFNL